MANNRPNQTTTSTITSNLKKRPLSEVITNGDTEHMDPPPAKKAKASAPARSPLPFPWRYDVRKGKKVVLVDESSLSETEASFIDSFEEHFAHEIENIDPQDQPRPASTVKYKPSGSPKKVTTPGGSKLRHVQRIGPVYLATDLSPQNSPTKCKPTNTPVVTEEFRQSAPFKAIKKIKKKIKRRKVRVTKKLLAKAAQERKNSTGRNQNAVMKEDGFTPQDASATEYAKQIFSVQNVRWEWLHLVANMIEGLKSQSEGNLICGTPAANSAMLLVESQLKYLVEHYPKGFDLIVTASLYVETHAGINIHYVIKTEDFVLPIDFDAQQKEKPFAAFNDYMRALFFAFIESHKEKSLQRNIAELPALNLVTFFKKTDHCTDNAPKSTAAGPKQSETRDYATSQAVGLRKRL